MIGVRTSDREDRRLNEGDPEGDTSEREGRLCKERGAVLGAGDVLIGDAVRPTVFISAGKMSPLRPPDLT